MAYEGKIRRVPPPDAGVSLISIPGGLVLEVSIPSARISMPRVPEAVLTVDESPAALVQFVVLPSARISLASTPAAVVRYSTTTTTTGDVPANAMVDSSGVPITDSFGNIITIS